MEDVYLKANPTHFWPSSLAQDSSRMWKSEMSYLKFLFSFMTPRNWKLAENIHQATVFVALLYLFFIINSSNRITFREILQPHLSWINPFLSLYSSHIWPSSVSPCPFQPQGFCTYCSF